MTEEPQSPEMFYNECETCFVGWYDQEKKKTCGYCEGMGSSYSQKQKLERMLMIMEQMQLKRLPLVLRTMYNVLSD